MNEVLQNEGWWSGLHPDIHSALIGIVTGLLVIYVHKGAVLWYTYTRREGLRSGLKNAEAEMRLIEDLASSDRALASFSFLLLFGVVLLGSVAMAARPLLAFVGATLGDSAIIDFVCWLFAAIFAAIGLGTVSKARRYEESRARIEKRIADLKARLSRFDQST
jgi:hypothetical protein